MSYDLKYNKAYSDEFDFVQEGEEMRELTVEITLAEYRQLIQADINKSLIIEELENRLSESERLNNAAKTFIAMNHPEIKDKISEICSLISKENEGETCSPTKIKDDNEGET